jgi:2-polyprenyl-3-methyl-5-hydroxy-6-metoxy-1,4-benzoquinol methylase
MTEIYDNVFSPSNVYGRTTHLLREFALKGTGRVHLDIGCGFGAIAPHVRDLGLTYVGVDLDPIAIDSVTASGFEAHILEFSDEPTILTRLKEILAGRALASVTILDTLEHVPSPLDVLRAIRSLIGVNQVPLILSVPNVTHQENVAKLAIGKFEYTIDGLLDRTHITHFSQEMLQRMTRQAGLVQIAVNDTRVRAPDRDLQLDSDALGQESSWFRMLSQLRELAGNDAISYQFVRAYLPGPAHDESWFIDPSRRKRRPFLSIVMRTTGRHVFALKDVLNCLTGQSDLDFEVLLTGHRLDVARQIEIEKVIEALPSFMRERLRFLLVEDGNRTKPLNVGYAAAQGHYIVTLDDDDLVFGHYVETFRSIAARTPGRLLRVRCASQPARVSRVDGAEVGAISTNHMTFTYPASFSFVDHLHDNHTPCMSVAYPRETFHVFCLRFDETLTTAEDYDFMMRAYLLFGIGESDQITCVYRRWQGLINSSVMHSAEEWASNRARILAKLDVTAGLLGPGTLSEIRRRTNIQQGPSEVQAETLKLAKSKRPMPERLAREWVRFKRRRLGME